MKFGMQVGLGPGHNVLDGDPAPAPPKGRSPPIFGPYLLRPNGCMDQDAIWYGARSQPRRLCVRWGPSPPPKFLAHVYYAILGHINVKIDQLIPYYSMLSTSQIECLRVVAMAAIFGLHRCTMYLDAACCYRLSSVVCWSVTLVSHAKTAALIEMPFLLRTRVGQRNHVLDGGPDPLREEEIWRGKGAFHCIETLCGHLCKNG